jgi:redox-sensitive bicupin YhaK (pirin superfamily)
MEIAPSYEQKTIPKIDKQGKLYLIASPEGAGHAVKIHADAKMYAGLFDGEESAQLDLDSKRKGYVHLIQGELKINGITLQGGDALLIDDEKAIRISDGKNAEVLVFDLHRQ